MDEIANCPICGCVPNLDILGYEDIPSISHCGATLESIAEWNRYAAAMELAEALAWKSDVEDFISYIRCRVQHKSFPELIKIADKAEDLYYDAEVRVMEVFK